ncbi:BlaI/MecI/CopY family transcriptional regulator [Patiriisocius sp. Uisw_017]|jgi:BlaI family penicillinase repressor|uniref:BlaI/MecI/CopY family transcriptional regulator n=1 Tax=Patiriisocius sp. Uisw_017 TaxID=3230968 RepID=UPI0039E976C8
MENLTNKEEEIMQAIWQLEKVFVKEIVAALPSAHHYNTISTIVRSLEKKNYVAYNAFGKTHQYFPIISKEKYAQKFFKLASQRYFNNSYKNMVSFFAKEEKISANELREIIQFIEKNK